mmetsp:Transcript_5389/g.16995  ORF Transcript_5389/g.16995 Transcript_5389/m.16995 type:complete len:101 (-) Transcript_5389:322-624(-)
MDNEPEDKPAPPLSKYAKQAAQICEKARYDRDEQGYVDEAASRAALRQLSALLPKGDRADQWCLHDVIEQTRPEPEAAPPTADAGTSPEPVETPSMDAST